MSCGERERGGGGIMFWEFDCVIVCIWKLNVWSEGLGSR